MPSRVKPLLVTGMDLTVDLSLIAKGTRVTQIAVVTLPATAAGSIGLRIGNTGDPVRLNAQGQVINLEGQDAVDGVSIAYMGAPAPVPTGLVEFALGGDSQ